MNRIRFSLAAAAILAAAIFPAIAQDPARQAIPPTTIESTGTAALDMTPDFADFTIVREVKGDTAEAALKQAAPFAAALEEELKKRELAYREITAEGPVLAGPDGLRSQATVVVRFALGTYQTSATGYAEFGALCDKLKTLASDMGCGISQPVFAVADTKSAESTVIGTAVENAYGWGEGVARILGAVITSVENVRVVDVKWAESAELKRMTCTATVSVKYTAAPNQP